MIWTRLLSKPSLDDIYTDRRYKMKIAPCLAQPLTLKDLKISLQTSALISPRRIMESSTVFEPRTKPLLGIETGSEYYLQYCLQPLARPGTYDRSS